MNSYDIGRVISHSWAQLRTNFWPVFGFVLVLYIAQIVASLVTIMPMMAAVGSGLSSSDGVPPNLSGMGGGFTAVTSLVYLVSLAITSAMYAGGFYAYAAGQEGERVTFGDCFRVGFRKMLPLLGLLILLSLGIVFGFILLIVPGVILALMWAVAMPAMVAEDLGVFESFSRSMALTKGCKGNIFLSWLVFFVILLGAYFVLAIVIGVVGGGSFALLGASADPGAGMGVAMGLMLFVIGLALFGLIVALLMYVMSFQCAIYRETRLVHEGTTGGSLQDVFA